MGIKEELDSLVVAKFATTKKTFQRSIKYVEYYVLDMIISVGYKLKSEQVV